MNADCSAQLSRDANDSEVIPAQDRRQVQAARFMDFLRPLASTNHEEVGVATSADARTAAFQLVYREYLKAGLCDEQQSGQYYSQYQTLPGSLTFVLGDQKAPSATASVVPDNSKGLPCEQIFPELIETIRREQGRPAEIMLLAVNSDLLPGGRSQPLQSRTSFIALANIFFGVFRHLHQHTDLKEAVILVNPRHRAIYECVGFRTMADARSYPSRLGLPAVPLHLSVERAMSFYAHGTAGKEPHSTATRDLTQKMFPKGGFPTTHSPCSAQPVVHHAKP